MEPGRNPSPEEMAGLGALGLNMLGINNRDITALEMDDGSVIQKGWRASPPGAVIVKFPVHPADVKGLNSRGSGGLVGTALLQADDPAAVYKRLSEVRIGNL